MLELIKWDLLSFHYIATGILLLVVIIGRQIATRSVKRFGMSSEPKRRWLILVRNVSVAILLLGLLFIWGSELRSLAISVVAILAAVVLATKELITCFTGAVLKAGSNSFRIGDRIEISNFRGEVIDHNLLTTTLLEIGPGQNVHQRTGRKIVLPNSLFLTSPVFNECVDHKFILHVFSVVVGKDEDWRQAERVLLDAANNACRDFMDEAVEHFEEQGRREGLDSSNAAPRITLDFLDAGKLCLIVRFAVPLGRRTQVEQEVLRAFADSSLKESNESLASDAI